MHQQQFPSWPLMSRTQRSFTKSTRKEEIQPCVGLTSWILRKKKRANFQFYLELDSFFLMNYNRSQRSSSATQRQIKSEASGGPAR